VANLTVSTEVKALTPPAHKTARYTEAKNREENILKTGEGYGLKKNCWRSEDVKRS
jgi:hypothetical protein